MIRVRFPNGQCVQYNEANFVVRGEHFTDIYESEKKQRLFAQVPTAMALIELIAPCSVTNPMESLNQNTAIDLVMRELRNLPYWKVRNLKQALKAFNAKTRSWKK